MTTQTSGEDHDLFVEWKTGKALQLLKSQNKQTSTEYHELRKKFETLKSTPPARIQTSLSPNYQKLLVYDEQNPAYLANISQFTTEDSTASQRLLDFSQFTKEKMLSGKMELLQKENEDEMFIQSGGYLQTAAHTIHKQMFEPFIQQFKGTPSPHDAAAEAFYTQYRNNFVLISQEAIVRFMLQEHFRGNSLLAFMIGVAFFEHGLQDAMCSYYEQNGNARAAREFNDKLPKFNDLLLHPDFKLMLQQKEDIVFLLRTFVGPLNSLNLRNVTLHGFIAPHEFRSSYTSFLIMLFVSMGPIFAPLFISPASEGTSTGGESSAKTPYRPVVQLTQSMEYGSRLLLQESMFSATGGTSNSQLDKRILDLLERSYFVIPAWKSVWAQSIEFYQQGKYFHCLMYLFPVLEHCIRRVFVAANECAASRLLTAERDSYYTTLDILLSTIPSSYLQNQENAIFKELGDVLSNGLFDMLIWADSPRVRDLLCHGNIDPASIPRVIADRTLVVALALCVKYDIDFEPADGTESSNHYYDVVLPQIASVSCNYLFNEYEPSYHPRNLLRRSIQKAVGVIKQFGDIMPTILATPIPLTSTQQKQAAKNPTATPTEADLALISIKDAVSQSMEQLMSALETYQQTQRQTLNEPHSIFSVHLDEKEVRKMGILTRITSESIEMSQNIVSTFESLTKMIAEKKAKDRNKQNLASLITYSSCLYNAIALFTRIAVVEFEDLEGSNLLAVSTQKSSASIWGAISESKWQRAFEVLIATLFDVEKEEFTSKFKYSMQQCPKKEAKRMFADFQVLFSKYKQQ